MHSLSTILPEIDKHGVFNEHFKNKYPDLWSLMNTYGSLNKSKIATRRLLGIAYTDGPLPYIDQLSFMDKIDNTKDYELISTFRNFVRVRNGLFSSDLAELSTYIKSLEAYEECGFAP